MIQGGCWSSSHYIHIPSYRERRKEQPLPLKFSRNNSEYFHLHLIDQNLGHMAMPNSRRPGNELGRSMLSSMELPAEEQNGYWEKMLCYTSNITSLAKNFGQADKSEFGLLIWSWRGRFVSYSYWADKSLKVWRPQHMGNNVQKEQSQPIGREKWR